MLENLGNYYVYAELIQNRKMILNTNSISYDNWKNHYNGILNIMKDGIETDFVKSLFVTVDFNGLEQVDLSIPDYYINLILWYPKVYVGDKIGPQDLFFFNNTTSKSIKNYIDTHFVEPKRMEVSNKVLNNAISDMLVNFVDIDSFSLFLANTLNLEDDIDLMEASPEYESLLNCDLSNVPIEKVKDVGLDITHQAIDIIINSKNIMGYEHCLKNPFVSHEGINIRQYKENNFNIGTKPDGQGSIYHEIINKSYITGGLENMTYQLIDSGSSRVAQIISKKNVGDSGGFSRILGLNNIGSFLCDDPNYDCGTRNFMHITIYNKKILNMLVDRYYRIDPMGLEYKISKNDDFLIGKQIYLRSPITCASAAAGHGVCYKCYGDLAYTNADINIGRIATEIISSQYTQKRLSAKHLLETLITIIKWVAEFKEFFEVDTNVISLRSDIRGVDENMDLSQFEIVIDPNEIQLENDEEFFKHNFYSEDYHAMQDEGNFYNEYITDFKIKLPSGEMMNISSQPDEDGHKTKIYFSKQFIKIIGDSISEEEFDEDSDMINISLDKLEEVPLFFIKIQNNDLGKNLDIFNDLIDKKDITKSYNKDILLEKLQETIIKGGIDCMSIHIEVILSNQVRSAYDRLKTPDWKNVGEPYEILTLNEALNDNPSIIISTLYRKLSKFYPISFKKTAPSIFDPFFMRKPKKFLEVDHEVWAEQNRPVLEPGQSPVIFFHDNKQPMPKQIKPILEKFSNREKTELDD